MHVDFTIRDDDRATASRTTGDDVHVIEGSGDGFDPVTCTYDGFKVFPPGKCTTPPRASGRALTQDEVLAEAERLRCLAATDRWRPTLSSAPAVLTPDLTVQGGSGFPASAAIASESTPAWYEGLDPDLARGRPDLKLLHLICRYPDLRHVAFEKHELGSPMFGTQLGESGVFLEKLVHILVNVWFDGNAEFDEQVLIRILHEWEVPNRLAQGTVQAFRFVRDRVTAEPNEFNELVSTILRRWEEREAEAFEEPADCPAGARSGASDGASTEDATTDRQSRSPRRGRLRDEFPNHFCNASTTPVTRWFSLPYLLDGSKEGLVDVAMVHALLWGRLDLVKAAKSRLYFTVTHSVSDLAERIRKRRDTVCASLARLEAQYRIYLPSPPTRGRNGTRILIGVQKGILFAPVLTPQRLWNLSMERYMKAVRRSDATTMAWEVDRLARHLDRLPDGDQKAALSEILQEMASGCRGP